jgi:acylphosphatase
MGERSARRVTVRGRVQGVFFRDSTRQQAQQHGVDGWVRNDPGGTVTVHLEGDADGVDAVIGWIRAGGPPKAAVADVDVAEVDAAGVDRFEVR